MSELARLQGEFQDYLLRGTHAIEARVVGSARVPIGTRLGIYAGAYGSRLIDALQSSYPALAALLGEEDFQALGAEYVRTHDSPYFSIRDYGDALEEFLGTHPRYAGVPLLSELARWEWSASPPRSGRSCASAFTRACAAWRSPGTPRSCGRR